MPDRWGTRSEIVAVVQVVVKQRTDQEAFTGTQIGPRQLELPPTYRCPIRPEDSSPGTGPQLRTHKDVRHGTGESAYP